MKLGISSYSLHRAIRDEGMMILDLVQWVADNGGEHIEIVPIGFTLDDDPGLVEQIRKKADEAGIDISNYAIGANFLHEDADEVRNEIERVKKQVDIAHALGVAHMRHDVGTRPLPDCTIQNFNKDLPVLVEACREIADYASQHNITTSVENHGYYIQASDRLQTLVHEVGRSNFRTLVDVGNFMCADENSVVAVKKNLPIASMIHLKDFHLRQGWREYGEGWFPTLGGNLLRGAIVGHGDIDQPEVIRAIKQSGYQGYISIEYEGNHSCFYGAKVGMDNARRLWNEA
ncbi:sugar phosphate isomerase/epimerase family protein [Paenibacillus mendelii]|uniref:Sugar phosphate isomerase/epimerase family protein n=1 Tax=Paenibacillus mendelii TaxID=206163 RepID=A0ABV6JIT8_9BACL|nr:sugar phosphate isomerase/epimerase family protein [Paenibacillus mendelii]MCQ6558755.1 sugar phosphate isomerase/epimerase [Paenibacillus mendelii]